MLLEMLLAGTTVLAMTSSDDEGELPHDDDIVERLRSALEPELAAWPHWEVRRVPELMTMLGVPDYGVLILHGNPVGTGEGPDKMSLEEGGETYSMETWDLFDIEGGTQSRTVEDILDRLGVVLTEPVLNPQAVDDVRRESGMTDAKATLEALKRGFSIAVVHDTPTSKYNRYLVIHPWPNTRHWHAPEDRQRRDAEARQMQTVGVGRISS